MNILNFILYCFKVLTLFNRILPKRKCLFLYANIGFRDNIKGFYDYLIENNYNEKYPIVCACNDYKEYKSQKIKNVRFTHNVEGIFYFLTSRYCFYCFGKYPIKPARNQIVVNLWHGMPLKKIGVAKEEGKKQRYFTHLLATSEYFKPIMMECFQADEEQIIINGNPRVDAMVRKDKKIEELFRFSDYNKIIFWCPTYREHSFFEETELPLIRSRKELNKLLDVLEKKNYLMIVKFHPLQKGATSRQFSNYFLSYGHDDFNRFHFDLYTFLGYCDGLITDYSSIYFEYLLLDRPIGFTVDDMQEYENERGFVFEEPFKMMPGMKIKNIEELLLFIKNLDLEDEYRNEREKVNQFVNTYQNFENSKRLTEWLGLQ